jgi:transcriptional regulator with XRE-family HTH domain
MTKYQSNIPMLVLQKEVRDRRRYKQKEIAIGSGLSEPMISRLMRETDISGVNYATARALADWLGVSMEELAIKEEE